MNRKTLFAVMGLISFFGCAPSIKVTKEFLDPDFLFGQIKQESKIRVLVTENVNVMEFKSSYSKEYRSDQQFFMSLEQQISDSIKTMIGCRANPAGTAEEVALLQSGSFEQSSVSRIQQMLGSATEDYFLVVTSVDITNKVTSNGPVMVSNPGSGGMLMSGGNSSESCVVIIHADLWNVKNKRKVLTCSSTGESTVTLLFYGTALKAAVENSVKYLVNYLATGRMT